jgi:hypothetical protein
LLRGDATSDELDDSLRRLAIPDTCDTLVRQLSGRNIGMRPSSRTHHHKQEPRTRLHQ